jgi:hypothetical protein
MFKVAARELLRDLAAADRPSAARETRPHIRSDRQNAFIRHQNAFILRQNAFIRRQTHSHILRQNAFPLSDLFMRACSGWRGSGRTRTSRRGWRCGRSRAQTGDPPTLSGCPCPTLRCSRLHHWKTATPRIPPTSLGLRQASGLWNPRLQTGPVFSQIKSDWACLQSRIPQDASLS